EPTLPQKLGIPEIISGKNVLIIAPTGIGKTESAMLPLFDMTIKNKSKPISVLYITPLRSLNRDLLDRLFWWADRLELGISVRHGDTTQQERKVQSESPPHVLITTPETLGAILTGKKFREHLRNVKHVIVDEIHELVDSKRGIQLSLLLERLAEIASFQRIGLSATIGSPKLVADFLKAEKIINAEAEKRYDISVHYPKPSTKDIELSDNLAIGVETTARLRELYELIEKHKSILVFTNTRETAEVLSSRLRSLDRTLKQSVHHGSLSKEHRVKTETAFKQGDIKSLISTSSLELGIDIGSIDLVLQYLSPRQVAKLIQRVGRSAHKVGKVSKGIIISGDEDIFESAVIAKKAMGKQLEEVKIHESALDVLATQIIGILMDEYEASDDRIYSIIKRAYPYRNFERKDFDELLKFLASLHLLWINDSPAGKVIRRSRKAFTYYFENLSTIPDTRQYRVISIIQGEPIGSLDEAFIAEHGEPGETFVCSGRAWKIIQVEERKVIVEPVEDIESAIPAWEGELIPVPFAVAQDVGKLRISIDQDSEKSTAEMKIDAASANAMTELIRQQKPYGIPDDKHILIEHHKDFIIIHSCFGSLVNDTLGRYLSALLIAETGIAVNMKTDPYRIILQTTVPQDRIKKLIEEASNMEEVLTAAIERSSLFKFRFLHVARRFGILSRSATLDKINMKKIISQYDNTPVHKETLREIFLEKMNLATANAIIKKIQNKEIKISIGKEISPLGTIGLQHQFSEVMKPAIPEKEIFSAFRKRLLSTRVRLTCMNCGKYTDVMNVKEVSNQPECPKCSSVFISASRRKRTELPEIVKKKLKKKQLSDEEMKEFIRARPSADLISVYGKKAVVALAGRGIGPQTAARLLAKLHPTKEKLLKDILEAEKEWVRTRKYWA
ncbi:MAG: DEAD/DEAH box helicase, partial [Candidatus Aenigmarchaeota archaeon]|nr:DEAD/DEAH box helicase [Candidatus Aenigmarchaeota archaeon]